MYNETTRLVKVVMPDYGQDAPPVNGGGNFPILNSANPTRASGDSGAIMLSDTAENLYIAYEVVAMVKDEETGKTHFSQLRWKKLGEIEIDGGDAKSVADPSGDGEQIGVKGAMRDGAEETEDETPIYYQFMFESGDLFVAAAADEYPALDGDELQMLSDGSSSGGGSGGSTGGGVLMVHAVEIEGTKAATKSQTPSDDPDAPQVRLDKTWQEIHDADVAFIYGEHTYDDGFTVSTRALVTGTSSNGVIYDVGSSGDHFYASSPNEYPVSESETEI